MSLSISLDTTRFRVPFIDDLKREGYTVDLCIEDWDFHYRVTKSGVGIGISPSLSIQHDTNEIAIAKALRIAKDIADRIVHRPKTWISL